MKNSDQERAYYVRSMFSRIAPRYDLMNRLMTFGQDRRWRREVIRRAQLVEKGILLDLGTGTGDLAIEALLSHSHTHIIAADFTQEMMLHGKNHLKDKKGRLPDWCTCDAQQLPFPDASFHAVVSGFLLRNVTDLERCLREQFRVLRSGGRLVALDTTPPPHSPLSPLINLYLHKIIPFLGRIITGAEDAYHYLPDTTQKFLRAESLAKLLSSVGFINIDFKRLMFGNIAIHWGEKP